MSLLQKLLRAFLGLLLFYWIGLFVYVGVAALSGGHAGMNRAMNKLFLTGNELARTRRGAESEIHCGYQVQIALLILTWGTAEMMRGVNKS